MTGRLGGAILVPASIHSDDAYGVTLTEALATYGVEVVAVLTPAELAPGSVAGAAGSGAGWIVVIAEQDGADAAVAAAAADRRVVAVVLLSPRFSAAPSSLPPRLSVLAIASKEDRHGLRGAVDAYLAGAPDGSRIKVGDGLGFGATMFAARAFERPDEERFEALIARWVAERLSRGVVDGRS